jgi:hypothetical protein
VSELNVIVEHAEKLLDIYASNPGYNGRAVFLLADDLVELMLRTYVRNWRRRNADLLSEPDNFPRAAIWAIITSCTRATLEVVTVKASWETLEANSNLRWFGAHLTSIQASTEYIAIRRSAKNLVECIEHALQWHSERNRLYHDPSQMRMAPDEHAVTDMLLNVLNLGNLLFTRRFEKMLRSQPLGRALFAWFHLFRLRYQDDAARKALERCFQSQPSTGKDKLKIRNNEDVGWAFLCDPDFGHAWILIHSESGTYASALEAEAVSRNIIDKRSN